MLPRVRWLGFVVCPLAAAAGSGPPAGADALVDRLGDKSYPARVQAQADLVRAGAAGLKAAEAAANHPNPEVRARAAAAAAELRRLADQQPLLAATPVPLAYTNVPLADALADLAARAKLTLALDPAHPDPRRPVTVSAPPLPAWEAVERFRRAAGLTEVVAVELPRSADSTDGDRLLGNRRGVAFGGGGGLRQSVSGTPAGPGDHAGRVPVVFAAAGSDTMEPPADRGGAVRVRALPAAFPAHRVTRGAGVLDLALDVTPPAGLHLANPRVRVRRAEDGAGRPVAPALPAAAPEPDQTGLIFLNGGVLFRGGNAVYYNDSAAPSTTRRNPRLVSVALNTGDRTAGRLGVLEGVVAGTVLLPNQVVAVVTDLARTSGRPVAGADGSTVTVTKFVPGPGGVEIEVRWDAPPGDPAGRPGASATPGDGFTFQDAAGKPVAVDRRGSSWQSTNGFTMTMTETFYAPTRSGVPAAMTVTGVKPVPVEVPFVLRDVPLP